MNLFDWVWTILIVGFIGWSTKSIINNNEQVKSKTIQYHVVEITNKVYRDSTVSFRPDTTTIAGRKVLLSDRKLKDKTYESYFLICNDTIKIEVSKYEYNHLGVGDSVLVDRWWNGRYYDVYEIYNGE